MLNTKPHVLTRAIDGDAMTLVFYPDTGCLRFADSRGVVCHELRPPHSWFAISSALREVRGGTHSMSEGLGTLLHDFCVKRSWWLSGRARMPASASARAFAPALRLAPRPASTPAVSSGDADMHAPLRSLTMNVAAAQ
jgi:hypothetical protein